MPGEVFTRHRHLGRDPGPLPSIDLRTADELVQRLSRADPSLRATDAIAANSAG
jgi:hypothetical protein